MSSINLRKYGQGKSTGMDQAEVGKIHTGFQPEDLAMSDEDREVLRRLAAGVAELAASEEMEARRRLWVAHNKLEQTRPLIFCDPENGWNEVITEDLMQCRGKIARRWEMDLRKELFRAGRDEG